MANSDLLPSWREIPDVQLWLMGGALLSTMTSGDVGGQIRCLELLGRGFEEVNRHAEAMRLVDRAIKLADGDKDSGLPFMAYKGRLKHSLRWVNRTTPRQ